MQVLAKTARASALRSCMRSFASAALEKPVLNKEFKIYRWVSLDCNVLKYGELTMCMS